MNAQQQQQKGFTIIEVILVLAIAALIFLMVFLALPALQRGQRDTQRRQDLAKVLTAVQNYQSNSQGSIPAQAGFTGGNLGPLATYLTGTFNDPDGNPYKITGTALAAGSKGAADTIYYNAGAVCGAGGQITGGTKNQVAVQIQLEGGGLACDSNN